MSDAKELNPEPEPEPEPADGGSHHGREQGTGTGLQRGHRLAPSLLLSSDLDARCFFISVMSKFVTGVGYSKDYYCILNGLQQKEN